MICRRMNDDPYPSPLRLRPSTVMEEVGGSEGVDIPGSGKDRFTTSGHASAYITPQSRQEVSSSPYTDSPTSFHTPEQMDYDYQQDINSEILESPSSSPPDRHQTGFYSDGRPRPLPHDGDDDSRDSHEDGGYTTATQIPASRRFAYPDQPKLLLAEEPVGPLQEKRPLEDGQTHLPVATPEATSPENHQHEGLHRNHRRKGRSHGASEATPLLPRDQEDKETSCCLLL